MIRNLTLLLVATVLFATTTFSQSAEEVRIRGSYQLAMGRDPEPRELAEWLRNVKSAPYSTMDVAQLANQHKNWINAYYKTSPDVKKLKEQIVERAIATAYGRTSTPAEREKYMNGNYSYTEIIADIIHYFKNSYGPWAHVIKRAYKNVNLDNPEIPEDRLNRLREQPPITYAQMFDLFAKERKIQKPRSVLSFNWLNLFIPPALVAEFNRFAGISNVISTGGGNVISTGGGNITNNASNVISTGGGNIFDAKGYVISTGGGNLIPNTGTHVISTGGGNVISTGGLN